MKSLRSVIVAALWMGFIGGCEGTKDPVVLYNMGVEKYNRGAYAQAMGMFKWALEEGREFPPALLGLARCHLALATAFMADRNYPAAFTDLEHALHWVNQAINADPGNTETYATKIRILKTRGQVEEALATARQAAALAGPSAGTLIMLARTYREQGDYDSAESALKQGIKVSPKNVELLVALAALYESIGRERSALIYYERAYEVDPYYPALLEKIAQLKAKASEEGAPPRRLSGSSEGGSTE